MDTLMKLDSWTDTRLRKFCSDLFNISSPAWLSVLSLLLFLHFLFLEDKGLTLRLKWTKKGAGSLNVHLHSLWDSALPTHPGTWSYICFCFSLFVCFASFCGFRLFLVVKQWTGSLIRSVIHHFVQIGHNNLVSADNLCFVACAPLI